VLGPGLLRRYSASIPMRYMSVHACRRPTSCPSRRGCLPSLCGLRSTGPQDPVHRAAASTADPAPTPAAAHSTRSSATDPKAPPASHPHHSESPAPNWPRKWDNVTWTEIHSYPCPKPEPPLPSELARESGSGSPVIRRARVSLRREMLELPMGGLDDGRAWKVRKLEGGTRP
jgi:hypothetical protein